MKKILAFTMLILVTITLSACGLFGSKKDKDPEIDAEALANAIVNSFNGDVTYLLEAIDTMSFEMGSQKEAVLELGVRMGGTSSSVTVFVTLDSTQYMTPNGFVVKEMIALESIDYLYRFEIITVSESGELVVYIHTKTLFDYIYDNTGLQLKSAFGLEHDWVRFDVLDTLATFVEIEILKEFVTGNLLYQLPVSSLVALDQSLSNMLQVDLAFYHVSLADFYETLLTFDQRAIENYLYAIDYEGVALAIETQFIVPNLLLLIEEYRSELTDIGYDVDALIATLENEGILTFVSQLEDPDFEALKALLTDETLIEMVEHYEQGTLLNYLLTTALSQYEYTLRQIEGFDYDGLYTLVNTLDMTVLSEGLMELDVEGLIQHIQNNTVNAYIDALEHREVYQVFDYLRPILNQVASALEAQRNMENTLDAFSNLQHYLDLSTYLNHALMSPTVAKNAEHEVITSFPITPAMLQEVIEGFLNDAYISLISAGMEVDPFELDTDALASMLSSMENVMVDFTYKPADLSYMVLHADLYPVLNMMELNGTFTKAILTVTNRQAQTVDIPTETSSLNMLIEDVAKLMLLDKAATYLRTYESYAMMNNLYYGQTMSLREMLPYIHAVGVFDLDLSYVSKDAYNNYTIDLFYLDQERVFVLPLSLNQINGVFSFPMNRTKIQTGLNYINDDSFYMTRLLLLYLADENSQPLNPYFPSY